MLLLSLGLLVAIVEALSIKRWPAPVVDLPYGSYRGYYNESNGLNVWRSIRFGADTSGPNRWRPPQPPVNQSGQVIDATQWPLQCPQATAGDNQTPASYNPLQPIDGEDCLFLTVAAPPSAQNLPVSVWVFGGGLLFNSMQEFDPQPTVVYANNSMVGVAIQYRPAMFGFLSTPHMGDGMNAGLKDCVGALEWIQRYIHLFGGDPNQVTIGGESAGGGLVLNLLAAQGVPGRKQLFQNAIVDSPGMPPQSNCNTGIWKTQWDQISSILGCANDDVDCVRNADTRKLRILNNDYQDFETWVRGNAQAYSPCIEGEGGYVVNQAIDSFRKGQAQQNTVLLSGNNFRDGYGRPPNSVNPSNASSDFQADADALFLDYMNHRWPVKDNDTESNQKLLQLYPLSDFPTNLDRTGQAVTDVQYACPSQFAATALNDSGYKFLYAVPPGDHAQDNYQESPWFCNHCLALYYKKYGSTDSPSFFASFLGSFISLIKTRNPNSLPYVRPTNDPTWPTWNQPNKPFKIFNVTAANISDSYIADASDEWAYRIGTPERCEFWAHLRIRDQW